MKIQPYLDGIELTVDIFSMPSYQFDALMACLKRNRESGKINIHDAHLDKNNAFHINILGIEGVVPQFIQLLECEILMAIPTEPPIMGNLQEKMLAEFHKCIDITEAME